MVDFVDGDGNGMYVGVVDDVVGDGIVDGVELILC